MKILVILLFTVWVLHADIYTLKLYEDLLGSIFKSHPISVFADRETKKMLKKSKMFKIVKDCDKSDFLMGSDFPDLKASCRKKPLFATSHRVYKDLNNSFGAFYWEKGRPQIHFKKAILDRYSISLPKKLKRFEDE